MTAVPVLPQSAPFAAEDIELLNRVFPRTTPHQRSWLAGFLAGYDAAAGAAAAQPVAAPRPKVPLTILYASESGNAEGLALKARKAAQKHGFEARVADMGDSDLDILTKAKTLLVYASTWGEGDPPQRAAEFVQKLLSDAAPRLDGVSFAVLGLGDTAYTNFCATGRAIDARLAALGGSRVAPRADLDLDFAAKAAEWTEDALTRLMPAGAPGGTVVHVDFKSAAAAGGAQDEPAYTAENPLEAEITALLNLNGTGSTRETWHVEIASEAPGFSYQPGDAIGILPENDPGLVADLLAAVGLGSDTALAAELVRGYDVTTLSRPVADAYAKLTGREDAAKLAAAPETFAAFAAGRQLIDLFETYPETLTAAQLKGLLRPLPGRLYSVASSLAAHPGEAHLLIGAVRWEAHGRVRKGVTSSYFAERRRPGDTVRLYLRPNRHFRLPADGTRPIVMIGAGTGIAPYRAFVEERAEAGATGPSWLFFGERNYTFDFLYQLEWQEHLASGALSRIDVAFSRDQPEKIYVQHRLWERRAELRGWLDRGAHIYVCGDEKGLGRDVDAMLARILGEGTAGGEEEGRARLAALRRENRYQRDVY